MQALVRKRYAAERRFRLAGLFAVGLSMLFLAILLFTMGSRGLGGFTHHEAALPIDFAKSDLFLDAAALRGPDAEQTIASADLESTIVKAATEAHGGQASEMFGGAAVRTLGRRLLADPTLLERQETYWLPVGSAVDVAAKHDSDAASEALVAQLNSKDQLRRRFNLDFLTASDATDPSAVGVWGALKGSFLTI
ncbi:MAG TPA: DUF3333 domain-containing protein, partial [Sphingomicrobium sp.]